MKGYSIRTTNIGTGMVFMLREYMNVVVFKLKRDYSTQFYLMYPPPPGIQCKVNHIECLLFIQRFGHQAFIKDKSK